MGTAAFTGHGQLFSGEVREWLKRSASKADIP
jgi:hypothetical protein